MEKYLAKFAEIDPGMSITIARVFVAVASRGDNVPQSEIEKRLGLTNASASRCVSYWTNRRFDREPGIGFFERREDDHDRRHRVIGLTPAGREFWKRLSNDA